jgi:putative nucleotidyltransferase with HDIG domain
MVYLVGVITEREALALLTRYGLAETRIRHCEGVAAFAYDLARRIAERHPELALDPLKVKMAALLHDIGREHPGDHEPASVAILCEEGLGDLADIVMHGSYYEIMKLRGIDDPSLLPRSLENKIVAYADTRFRLEPISVEERVAEILQRRADEPEKIESLRMALPRYEALEAELLALAG